MTLTDLHQVNPYVDFPLADWPARVEGWNSTDAIFRELIQELNPQLIVEVGTWLGASALHMAGELARRQRNNAARIVCVDTWLGALEFWTKLDDPERHQMLRLRHGYPSVYYQFLANVIHAGAQNVIIPFPQTSLIAARWFAAKRVRPDLIYLDASHEEADVKADMAAWFEVLRPGGVLLGDDYSGAWPGVRAAVDDWPGLLHPVRFHGEKWVIRKGE